MELPQGSKAGRLLSLGDLFFRRSFTLVFVTNPKEMNTVV